MTVAADAGHADPFSFQIFRPLQLRSGNDAVGQDILDAANEDEVRRSLHEGAHKADAPGQSNFGIAAVTMPEEEI